MTDSEPHNVLVVGGGAAGLELATKLGDRLGKRRKANITLVDSSRTHIWKPLLHQVASGASDSAEHALEYLVQGKWHHFRFRLGEMDGLDRDEKTISLAPVVNDKGQEIIPRRKFSYDTLVMAVGSISNDFGIEGVSENCLLLDNKEQATRFQKDLLEVMIRAHSQDAPIAEGQLDVAIIGAGATGVELAAQLHHVSRQMALFGLDEIDPEKHMRITIIEAAPRILTALPERLSAAVTAELERLGIRVMAGERVSRVTTDTVHTASGKNVPAAIKVWAAGIQAPGFISDLDLETNNINQIKVTSQLLSTVDSNIFALGDCSEFPPNSSGETVPPRAQAAHQQASFVARAIVRRISGKEISARYVYRDYGALVTLGKYSTVGSLMGKITGSVRISGFIARMVYLSLYKSHQVALHGYWRTALYSLSQLLRRSVDPAIKLH